MERNFIDEIIANLTIESEISLIECLLQDVKKKVKMLTEQKKSTDEAVDEVINLVMGRGKWKLSS